jgi:hypothetical protein
MNIISVNDINRKCASYDVRQGGWIVWDRHLLIVRGYYGKNKMAAIEASRQLELDLVHIKGI